YRFGAGIFYANATRLSDEVLGLLEGDDPARWLIVDAAAVDDLDFSGGQTLAELADEIHERGVVLSFCDVSDKVRAQLDSFGITAKIGPEHIYDTLQEALDAFHDTH